MLQFIEFAQVLFPCLVDEVEHDSLFKLLYNRFCLSVVSLLEVARYVVHAAAVGDGHHDALVDCTLILVNAGDDRHSYLLYALGAAVKRLHNLLEHILVQLVALGIHKLFFGERHLHCEYVDKLLLAAFVVVVLDDVDHTVPQDVCDVHSDALTHEGVAAFLVYHGALLVHYVIIFEQTLTHAEMVFLNLALGTLDALAYHAALNHLAFLESETVHDRGYAL